MSEGEQDSAAHKKRRLQGACDECKKRKIKCDSATRAGNTCSSCLAFRTECTHILALAKKKRGPPRGTPRGTKAISTIANSIISAAQSNSGYEPPSEYDDVKKLIVDLANHIKSLDEEIFELRQQLIQQQQQQIRPSLSSASNLSIMSSPQLQAPPGSYLDADHHAIEGLSEHLRRLNFENAKDRHFGGSSSIMLVKTAIDIKNEYTGEDPSLNPFRPFDEEFEPNVTGNDNPSEIEPDYKRPEFWAIHPFQILPLDDSPPFVFPDADLIDSLVSLYFSNVDVYYPILHRPSFIRSVAENLHHKDQHFGALLLAVCALAARFSDDPRVYEEYPVEADKGKQPPKDPNALEQSVGWKWIRQIQPIKQTFMAPPSIYEIQLYGVYIIFMQATTTPEACWILVAIGVRFAQDVGAHRKKVENVKPTLESELWKRAFWMLYALDIFVSAFLGRPRSISKEDFDVDLPVDCDDEYWETEDPEKAFQQPPGKPSSASYQICLINLLDVMGFALGTIYAIRKSDLWTSRGMTMLEWNENIVAELDSSLNQWVDNIPDHLRWDPNRENPEHFHQSVMIYTTYYWVQIQIHRPFIAPPGEGSVLSFPSLAICANAARSCSHVMEVQRRRNAGFLVMPNLEMALFTSSIVLLVNVYRARRIRGLTGSKDVEKELSDVYRCINLISMYEKRWQQAGRFCDILREIIRISHFHHDSQPTASRSMKRSRDADFDESGNNLPSSELPERQIASRQRVSAAMARNLNPMDQGMLTHGMHVSSTSELFSGVDFTLPTHSSELGSLPVYEPFADWPMHDLPFSFTPSTSFGPQPQSTWPPSESPSPAPVLMEASSRSRSQTARNSGPLFHSQFDGLETSLGVRSNQDSFYSSFNTNVPSTEVETDQLQFGDVYESQDANARTFMAKWDDWGSYIASVDEVLQSMQRR